MSDIQGQSPIDEQKICVTCGMCCDGTLFWHATLQPGEKGSLPEKIERKYRKEGKDESFKLPCLYFNEKCTIYDQKKAEVCSSYRCQLLKDFADQKISFQDALEIIKRARMMRKEVMEEYRRISGNEKKLYFKELLTELGKVQKKLKETDESYSAYEMLIARCNIFESLLMKHIRSTSDFNDMMTPSPDKDKKNKK